MRTLLALIAAGAVVALTGCGDSDITRARLERSLPETFSNLYVQQAAILGHDDVTKQSLQAKAQCDKGGPKAKDRGPGSDWICLMTWKDPNIDRSLLPGKFEMNVHSNNCYTAGGPSKIVGLFTIPDRHGNDVLNPVFEFDGCFDPNSSNAPTGVTIPTPPTTGPSSPAPAGPTLSVTRARLTPDARGRIAPGLRCAGGDGGCAGTVSAALDGHALGSEPYAVKAGRTSVLHFRLTPAQRRTGGRLRLRFETVAGHAPAGSPMLDVAAGSN